MAGDLGINLSFQSLMELKMVKSIGQIPEDELNPRSDGRAPDA